MYSQFTDKELMRDIYIGFESLRRSSDLISKEMYAWLQDKLQASADRGAAGVEARLALWIDFGVDPETAALLAQQLQLVWTGHQMLFLEGACWDGDLLETVASAVCTVWRFQRFTESRWLTVGSSFRIVVAALLSGLESFVAFLQHDPDVKLG